ncbi:MAG: hypothetical protein U5R46_17600 [Gammaproteobacteria bacterium]|nr:hypothetical protein [Gammaproteobacteria bacterium]
MEKDTEAKQTLEAMFPTMTDAQEPADLAVQIVMSPEGPSPDESDRVGSGTSNGAS